MPLKVLHIVPSLYPRTGGPARSVPGLCGAEARLGADVTLFAMATRGARLSISPEAEAFDVQTFEPLIGSTEFPTYAFRRRVRGELARTDLVHLHGLWNPAISVAASECGRARIPYVISPRGMLQDTSVRAKRTLKRIYHGIVERETIRRAAAIHFLTESEAERSRAFLVDGPLSFIVPNGTDAEIARGVARGRFRSTHPEVGDRRIVLFVGRVHSSKGLDIQAGAVEALARDGVDVAWVLAGPDGGAAEEIRARARAAGTIGRLVFTGLIEQARVFEALVDADVFLTTSVHEGHSMALNEALSVGTPIVMTDSVEFPDAVEVGAAIQVPRDPKRVGEAIRRVLGEAGLAERMRESGRALVRERLAWPIVARSMLDRYMEILARGERSPEPARPRVEAR